MPHGEYAECPHCCKTAYGRDEIEEKFGYRYGGTVPQSWCRDCRSSSSQSLSVYDAAQMWLSSGKDEDYMFGYTEEELENAL